MLLCVCVGGGGGGGGGVRGQNSDQVKMIAPYPYPHNIKWSAPNAYLHLTQQPKVISWTIYEALPQEYSTKQGTGGMGRPGHIPSEVEVFIFRCSHMILLCMVSLRQRDPLLLFVRERKKCLPDPGFLSRRDMT